MGYTRHHAIVVTAWDEQRIRDACAQAERLGCAFTNYVESAVNSEYSFLIAPDGSKEGWPQSLTGDSQREKFVQWLQSQRHSDGSSPFAWCEVQYADDAEDDRLLRSSNTERNAPTEWEAVLHGDVHELRLIGANKGAVERNADALKRDQTGSSVLWWEWAK